MKAVAFWASFILVFMLQAQKALELALALLIPFLFFARSVLVYGSFRIWITCGLQWLLLLPTTANPASELIRKPSIASGLLFYSSFLINYSFLFRFISIEWDEAVLLARSVIYGSVVLMSLEFVCSLCFHLGNLSRLARIGKISKRISNLSDPPELLDADFSRGPKARIISSLEINDEDEDEEDLFIPRPKRESAE